MMELESLQNKSMYYWLKGILAPYPIVNVTDDYPDQELQLPTVVIQGEDVALFEFEQGSRRRIGKYLWVIDIYASNKSQRDELASKIIRNIDTYGYMDVYDYNEGFPPATSPTKLGNMSIIGEVRVSKIKSLPSLMEKLYWRTAIRFYTEYNSLD